MIPDLETRQFVIDISVYADMARSAADDSEAADELLDMLTKIELPAWVFSIDSVEPK